MAITVTKEGDRWVARFPFSYETKDIVKAAGFRFDGLNKVWWTRDSAIAAKLDDTGKLAEAINQERVAKHTREQASIDASRASTSNFQPPAPAGLSYLPYQRAGIEYALSHNDVLIADEMGLGKTIQAIGIINTDATIANVLVICPASVKRNWHRECLKWLTRKLPVTEGNGTFPSSGVVIINYEMIAKYRPQIDAVKWDMLICDESHYLKNPKAARTQNVFGKRATLDKLPVPAIAARRRVFLTGTPLLNRPCELWTLVHSLDPNGLGRSWKQFHHTYCNAHQGRFGWDISGASNLEELQTRLRSSIMVRRRKADVLTELPPMRRQVLATPISSAAAKAALLREQQVVEANERTLNALRAQVEALSVDQASDAYTAAVRALKQAEGVAFTEIAKVRHETALAKVPDVVAHLRDCLESEDKLLVMAHHKDVVAAICAELAEFGVVHITGDDSLTARDKAQTAFQTDPGTRVIVCSIMAAGVGITLHAASHVVFAELDWTPGNMMQAEARAHRIGQRKSVLVQHVVLDGSLDCRMAELLIQKQEVIEAVTDRTTAPLPEPELISAETLAQIAGRMCECGHSWNEHIRTANGAYACKHHGCGCRDVVPDNDLPPAQVQAIHTAMRMLASMCDGARALDGHGFNKLDAPFGHAMAANATLTQNMAKASRKLAVKYGKQLPSDLLAACKG